MIARIFVTYRREETRHIARLIYERLVTAFSERAVFFDVHKIPIGLDFRERIDNAVRQSAIMVAVIGPQWLAIMDRRQHSKEDDWVRYEIGQAFAHGLAVVPVLVDGAQLPREGQLPAEIQKLAYSNLIAIHDDMSFDADVQLLIAKLRETLSAKGCAMPADNAQYVARFWDQRQGRRRGFLTFVAAVLIWLLLVIWRDVWPPAAIDKSALGALLYNNCWISYDASQLQLDVDRRPIAPDVKSIRQDLNLIKAAGFSGILTFCGADGTEQIPRLAHEHGLGVILGIWDASDRAEVSRAIRFSSYVDAYCVGNNGLPDRYSLDALERALYLVKKRTGRPATVSEEARKYNLHLAALGDWLFPDAHLTLRDSKYTSYKANVSRDVDLLMESTKSMCQLAQELSRPLLFKNVAYPHSGIPGASPETQAVFFRDLLDRLNDPQRGPVVKVSIVAQSAFDAPWKVGKPFVDWDPYTGLIDAPASAEDVTVLGLSVSDDRKSPAVREILRWFPHLTPRTAPKGSQTP